MTKIHKIIIDMLESKMTPISISYIRRELKNHEIDISHVKLSGYLDCMEELGMIALIPVAPAKGYMGITAYWRKYGQKYRDIRRGD